MTPAGQFLAQLYDDLDASDDDKKQSIRRRLNLCYRDMAGMLSWQAMRKTTTLSFTGSNVLLPSNLAGIDAIYNSSCGPFSPRERGQIGLSRDASYRWCIPTVVSTPLVVASTGIGATKGSTAITGLSTDYTGEFIVFTNRLGIYSLAAQNTLAETFFEETVQNGGYTIRPAGTKYIAAFDPDGNPYAGNVTMDYWTIPQPITDDSQMILLPSCDALAMFVTMRHIGLKNIDDKQAARYQREYSFAYARACDMNPIYTQPNIPTGINGATANWGAQGS